MIKLTITIQARKAGCSFSAEADPAGALPVEAATAQAIGEFLRRECFLFYSSARHSLKFGCAVSPSGPPAPDAPPPELFDRPGD